MNNQNNSLETNNVFSKIKVWLYNLFHKSKKFEINVVSTNNLENQSGTLNEKQNDENDKVFFEEYKEQNERRQYLLSLQRRYKKKEILEEEMSEEDRIDLEKLYEEQNAELKRKIKSLDSRIAKFEK